MRTARNLRDTLSVGLIGAISGYAFTFVVRQYAPALWLVWFVSGAVIAFLLTWWRPASWLVAGMATPSLVIAHTVWAARSAPPTAAALSLGFAAFWAGLTFLGALAGRASAPSRQPADSP